MTKIKPTIDTVTNVHVMPSYSRSGWKPDQDDYGVAWQFDGARYHYWVKDGAPQGTIFKNSLAMKTTEPGYFPARRLDRDAAANREMIDVVEYVVRRDKLLEKALAEEEAKLAEQRKQAAEFKRTAHICEHGVMLYDALKKVDAMWAERYDNPDNLIANDAEDRDEAEWSNAEIDVWRGVRKAIDMAEDQG